MKSHDWIFRVLDIGTSRSGGDLFVGTGFLVSAKGYALTCWHNFDSEFALKRFEKEKEIENLRIAPRWGKAADEGNWRKVKVVGKWSNPDEDFVVLKLDPETVKDFRLRPAPLALKTLPGMHVKGTGFHRPWELPEADVIEGHLRDEPDPIKILHDNQHVMEVIYKDLPFEQGMSGGPLASSNFELVIGMETASDLPHRDAGTRPILATILNKQEARGYATPISVIAQSWPEIEEYCRIVTISVGRLSKVERLKQSLADHRSQLQALRRQKSASQNGRERIQVFRQVVELEKKISEVKSSLRKTGFEPEPTEVDPLEEITPFEEEIIQTYPLPIAETCHQFNQHGELAARFVAFDRLINYLIKYLAAVAIGQVRRDEPGEYPLSEKLAWIAAPALENWTESLCEMSQLYESPSFRDKWLVPEFQQACRTPLRTREALIDAFDFLALEMGRDAVEEPTVLDFLHLLAGYRERRWQQAAAQYPAKKALPVLLRLQPAFKTLLREFHCLRDYPLVYLEYLAHEETDSQLRLVKFMGRTAEDLQPPHRPALRLPHRETNHLKRRRFYVADTSGVPQLDLHPLFVLYRWELYVLERQAHMDFVEFRSCTGGRIFKAPPEAKTLLASWLESKEADGHEAPPVLGEEENWQEHVEEIRSDPAAENVTLTWLGSEGKQALEMALGEALRIGHFWLGVEFLLMALTKQEGALFCRLLQEMGASGSEFRGVLRGMVGVLAPDGWQTKNVLEMGAEVLPRLQNADPQRMAGSHPLPQAHSPVITPRMMRVLEEAHELAGHAQVGHAHLLRAALEHGHCLAVSLFYSFAANAGWDPRQVLDWLREQLREAGQEVHIGHQGILAGQPDRGPRPGRPVRPRSPGGKSLLEQYGRDLNAEARSGKIHPAYGVDSLLRTIKRILIQREANNPLLIGEAGVGKTAIVEGLACELASADPGIPQLAGKQIVELSINRLVAGTRYRGDLEETIEGILAEVKASPDFIVFIDELHTVLGGAGSVSDIANALKPALARGEFPCIGATTIDEYRRHIEKDRALSRRFEVVQVEEPDVETTIRILQGVKPLVEDHYGFTIPEAAIKTVVELSRRYLPDERLPAKAIRLLEHAAAYVKLPSLPPGAGLDNTEEVFMELTEDVIRRVLSKKTGIPLERLGGDELSRIKDIEEALKKRVIGQDHAVHEVAQLIKQARAGLKPPGRPTGVFLFMGPTGVGKTELARTLARFLFGDREALIRLDMSEFMEKHQVSRLIGAPPGYVGYEEEGQLTGKLRLKPFSVVLLDEIEKAHEDIFNIFLQLFDEGRLTDSKGRTVNGREATFIMTSNIGTGIYVEDSAGFLAQEKLTPAWLEEKRRGVEKAVRARFKREFLNRVDRIIYFKPLTLADVTEIFRLQFAEVAEQLHEKQNIGLEVSPKAVAFVCQQGYDALNGVRPLARAIQRLITQPLTDMILQEKIEVGERIRIDFDVGQLRFEKIQERN